MSAFQAPVSKRASTSLNAFNFGNLGKKSPKKAAAPAAPAAPAPTPSSFFAGGLVGSDVEVPDWDPFKLSDGRSAETLSWYRAAELKHARICMLACLGLWTQPGLHLPDPVFDSTGGIGALQKLGEERPEAIFQIVAAIAAVETFTLFKDGQGEAGDLGWDPLELQKYFKMDDASNREAMQLKELKNGRLAMIGASAMLVQEGITGYGPYEQLLHIPGSE